MKVLPHAAYFLLERAPMKPASKRTVMTLANAIEVAAGVAHEISGSDTATTLNGSRVTRAALGDMVASRLQARFAKHVAKPTK